VLVPKNPSPTGLTAMPAANFQAPRVHPSSPAGQVLESALRPPTQGELSGQPLPLTQLLSRIGAREGRKAAVLSYWRLCMAVAQYHFSVDEVLRLQRMPQPTDAYDQKQFAAVQSSAQARVTAHRLEAIRAQREVARFASEAAAALPLAADRPFVGAYQTHYQVLREHGAAPLQLALIDQTLPVQQQLITDLAVAVQSADELVEVAADRYQQQQLALADVLGAFTSLREQRLGFLAAVESYNASIAEYALTVNLPASSGDRLVGMLIETTPGPEHSVLTDRSRSGGAIQRVSNEEPVPPATQDDPSMLEPASVSPQLPPAQNGVLLPVPQAVDPTSVDPVPMQFPYPAAPAR
jgi:hypothetical protein